MLDFPDLPACQGIYVLHLFLSHPQALVIGRLGQYHLPAGPFFYIGSARGAGGLRSRVGRHLRGDGAMYWHVDTLRAVAEVQAVFYTVTDEPLECVWSQSVAHLPQAFIPVPHFGSSDCRSGCAAHLIAFPDGVDIASVQHVLGQVACVPLVRLCFR